jgi:hypothetical protein
MLFNGAEKAFREGERIGTERKGRAERLAEIISENARRAREALSDQKRAIKSRNNGAADWHAQRVEKYIEEIDAAAAQIQTIAREVSGQLF